MRKQRLSGSGGGFIVTALLGLGALFFCLVTGLLAAVVPAGTLVRLLAVPLAVLAVLLLWVLPKRRKAPDRLLNGLLYGLIVLINLWPSYIVYRFGGLPSVNPTKLAWLAFLVVGGFSILSSAPMMARLATRCRAHPLLIFSVLFLMVWRIVSSAAGPEPIPQVLSLGGELITCYTAFFLALAVLRDERDVFRLLTAIVAAALVQALLASYESAVRHTLFEKFMSISAEDGATMIDTVREKFRDGHYRAQGTFEHPMVLAEFMAMVTPLALTLFLSKKNGTWRWIVAAFIPLALAVNASSHSRSGIAVLLAAMVLLGGLLMLPRGERGRSSGASLSLVMSVFMLPVLLGFVYFSMLQVSSLITGRTAGEVNSTMSRVLMLERGVPLLKASPLLGYGNGMGPVKLGFWDGVRFNIDNYWLGMVLDAGIPGLVAFIAVFGLGALLGLRYYKQRDDAVGLAAGFMAISIVIMLGCKTVLSIGSGLTLAYVLVAAIMVLGEAPLRSASTTVAATAAQRERDVVAA